MVSVQNGSKIIMCKEKPLNYSGVVQNFSLVLECLDERILDNLLRKFFCGSGRSCTPGLPLNQNQSKKFSKRTSIFAALLFHVVQHEG